MLCMSFVFLICLDYLQLINANVRLRKDGLRFPYFPYKTVRPTTTKALPISRKKEYPKFLPKQSSDSIFEFPKFFKSVPRDGLQNV